MNKNKRVEEEYKIERKKVLDAKAISARERFLNKIVEKYKEPVIRERIKPARIVEEIRWDYFSFFAQRERDIKAAEGVISEILGDLVAKKASGSVVQLRKIKRKKNGDPPPLIENICRTIIPLGGKVVIYGENFVDGSSEVYIQLNDCHCTEPLDPDYFGDCGCWSMYPGQSIGWADRVIADGTILIFTMPDDFLTHDETFTTATVRVHNFSYLAFMVKVPGEGESNQFDAYPGKITTVPRSAFDDPLDVHTRPLVELEDLLLNMINEIRGWNGVGPLGMDARLREVARTHAQLMNDQWGNESWVGRTCTGWLDCSLDLHQAPGESTPEERVRDAGFAFGGEIVDFRWGAFPTPIKDAAEFWDNSCGHRDILIDSAVRSVGIGIARSEKTDRAGHTYPYYTYTCDFAR